MSLVEGRLWSRTCYHDRPSPTLTAISDFNSKLRSQASLHGVNHNMPFPTALKSLSAHWKYAKGMSRFSGKFLGIDYALLPNREWNQKQKTALEQRGMLRIWPKDKNRSPFHGEKPLMIK